MAVFKSGIARSFAALHDDVISAARQLPAKSMTAKLLKNVKPFAGPGTILTDLIGGAFIKK